MTTGANVSHRVDMTFDGDSVTIEGLVSNDKFDITATYPVKGYYDAKGKTITIKTPCLRYAKGRKRIS
jgi:hypothetical protein